MTLEDIKLYGKSGNSIRPDRVMLPIDKFDWLISEVEQWQQAFHERCDVQLDEFRKFGMDEAAKRCAEIAENTCLSPKYVAALIRKEFNLDNQQNGGNLEPS